MNSDVALQRGFGGDEWMSSKNGPSLLKNSVAGLRRECMSFMMPRSAIKGKMSTNDGKEHGRGTKKEMKKAYGRE